MEELYKGFLTTSPLWKNQQFGLHQFEFPAIDLDDLASAEVPNNLRLGHQMEYVFEHLIQQSKTYQVVYKNVLVEEGKIHIGELDFILKNLENHKYLHVELAYKFYVIDPTKSEPIYRLLGPNKRDMFYTKLDKLKDKQFALLYHPSLQHYWDTLNIHSDEIVQQCCFKAQLFTPYNASASIRPLNTACVVGQWLRFEDFNSKAFKDCEVYIPFKREWVIEPHAKVSWLSHFDALLDINLRILKENAPMIWLKRPTGTIEKLFVVWW